MKYLEKSEISDKINKKLRGGQPLRHERTDCNER